MIVSKRIALAVGGVAAVAVIGTAGVAAATGSAAGPALQAVAPAPAAAPGGTAAPADPTERAGGNDRAGKDRPGRLARLTRGLHGEFVVKGKDGGYVTVVTVRGTVTAVSPTSVTVRAEDGYTATFAVDADTKVHGKDVDGIGDVRVGDSGGAAGVKSGDTITAHRVLIRQK